MNEDEVAFDGSSFLALKCIKRKYAELMVNQGSIRFSLPQKWVNMDLNDGNRGQGDRFEGIFEVINNSNESKHKSLLRKYGNNLSYLAEGVFNYYRLLTTMQNPTYCFYTLKDTHLKGAKPIEGFQDFNIEIPKKLFLDFATDSGIRCIEDWRKTKEEEQPVLVVVRNTERFYMSLAQACKDLGIMRSSYLAHNIDYISIQGSEFVCPKNHPQELFYKDISFDYQCETRIVINSRKYRGMERDINIGPMQEYADIVEYDEILNGVSVKLKAYFEPQKNKG